MNNKIIEALLFIQGSLGVNAEQIKEVFKLNTASEGKKMLQDFKKYFNLLDRGIKVYEFDGVYKFLTSEIAKDHITSLLNITRKQKLSNAAIEVAGIVAYKQPITRSAISNIRGVISDGIVASLLEKGIIEEVGVAQSPGSPILYGITNKFYDYFKIKTLAELPNIPEFDNYSNADENLDKKDFNLFDSQRTDTNNDGFFIEEENIYE